VEYGFALVVKVLKGNDKLVAACNFVSKWWTAALHRSHISKYSCQIIVVMMDVV
jgi:hypothetical protein